MTWSRIYAGLVRLYDCLLLIVCKPAVWNRLINTCSERVYADKFKCLTDCLFVWRFVRKCPSTSYCKRMFFLFCFCITFVYFRTSFNIFRVLQFPLLLSVLIITAALCPLDFWFYWNFVWTIAKLLTDLSRIL